MTKKGCKQLTKNDRGLYRITNSEILRKGVSVATHNGETVIVREGFDKFNIIIKQQFTKWKKKRKELNKKGGRVDEQTIDKAMKIDELTPAWLITLRQITGLKDLSRPERGYGWKRSKVNDILKKKYKEIIKSELLSNEEKKSIIDNII